MTREVVVNEEKRFSSSECDECANSDHEDSHGRETIHLLSVKFQRKKRADKAHGNPHRRSDSPAALVANL